jgi:tetratricopeptide (TPR) repeat protein
VEIMRRKAAASTHTEVGNGHFDAGDLPAAIAEYDKALELVPKHVEALGNRANAYSTVQNHAAAIADTTKLISILSPQLLEPTLSEEERGALLQNLSITR